jgi:signal transduction histidine kinase
MVDSKIKTLKVTTRCDDENVYVDITDTGHGLEPEEASKIFAPFFTTKPPVGEAREGRPTGTGLGLPSSVGLSAKYGGRIHVEGRRGVGATFTVVLPIEQNRPEACRTEAERS